MGRELKRVPLDFNWPLNQVWKGYLSPYAYHKCKYCKGTGYNKETRELSEDWYGFERPENRWDKKLAEIEVKALIDENKLWDFT